MYSIKLMHGLTEFSEDELIVNWFDAMEIAHNRKEGWRLPTSSELEAIYNNKDFKYLNFFQSEKYWSMSEWSKDIAWCVDFKTGEKSKHSKEEKMIVRFVRVIKQNVENTYY